VCSGRGFFSSLIAVMTYGWPHSSPTHVGLIDEYDGLPHIFHSTDESGMPCAVLGHQNFAGSQAQPLAEFVNAYRGRVWYYPLACELYEDERQRLSQFLLDTIGRPYDMPGAVRAGGLIWSRIWAWFKRQDLSWLFCSEWAAAAWRTTRVLRDGNASRYSPARLLRTGIYYGILDWQNAIELKPGDDVLYCC
jgi:hypothetical protein